MSSSNARFGRPVVCDRCKTSSQRIKGGNLIKMDDNKYVHEEDAVCRLVERQRKIELLAKGGNIEGKDREKDQIPEGSDKSIEKDQNSGI